MATKKQAPVSLCRHCGRAYRVREKGSDSPPGWLGTEEEWQDVCNEHQDFFPCQSKQVDQKKPEQLKLF